MRIQYCLLLSASVLLGFACSDDSVTNPGPGTGSMESEFTVWDGPVVTFQKADGAHPADPSSQDRITDGVILTRGNNGGQIYNAAVENVADMNLSPRGTLWALGATSDIESLNFNTFRNTVEPKEVVGKDMVLLLEEDSIVMDIKFTSWSQGKLGGFAYERRSE